MPPETGTLLLTEPYTTLPRGGYLVDTSEGYVQIGSPPETIKDTMFLPKSAPQIFVLPRRFFHKHKGISVAELEFPIYYNHFLRKLRTQIVCTQQQMDQLKTVLQESVFGPEHVDLRSEYSENEKSFGFPDIMAEMDYFRGNRRLEDLVRFLVFDDNDQVRIGQVLISRLPEGEFLIADEATQKTARMPGEVGFNIIFDTGGALAKPYEPRLLGITCLGPSHGFDPEENTSGFILWINHKGTMVDPPVNSTEWLRQSNVNPKDINSVILTHCHADHDAGTFQKILEEEIITVYTTETVLYSFLRKYTALTQIPIKELMTLFDFVPIIIGKPYIINGAEFHFTYALHSIPSLSFSFTLQDQSFTYSSDHLNDPERFKEMRDQGILPESRYLDLLDFPWHHNIIYHEAGIPPLHTRIDYLRTLPPDVQKKITVYHIAKKDMPPNTDLTLARFGMKHTNHPPVKPLKHEGAYKLLDAICNIDIFRSFPMSKAKDFLVLVEEEEFKRGETIIRKNSPGDKFYIILSGQIKVIGAQHDGGTDYDVEKRYGTYEYFGEASLILNQPRSADVVAETDVRALTIEKTKFLNFIKGSDLAAKFARLSEIRTTGTWDVLNKSRFFRGITSNQTTQLELIMEQRPMRIGESLIRQGERFDVAFIIKEGTVQVRHDHKIIETLGRGDFCGEIFQLQKEAPSTLDFRAEVDGMVYALARTKIIQYIKENPGVYMRLAYVYGD